MPATAPTTVFTFDAAVATWRPQAEAFAHWLLQRRDRLDLADEVPGVVLFALWRAWSRCTNPDTFRPFAMAWVKGRVKALVRSIPRPGTTGVLSLDAMTPKERDGLARDRHGDRGDRVEVVSRDHVRQLLAVLPEGQRVAIEEHYLAGVPVREIARRAGSSKQAAHVRLNRGLATLRGEALAVRLAIEAGVIDADDD